MRRGRGGCVRSDHTLIAFYFPPSNQGNFKSFFGRPLVLTFHSAVIDGRWAVAVIVQVIWHSAKRGSRLQTQYIHGPRLLTIHRRYWLPPIINMYASDWYFFLGTNDRLAGALWRRQPAVKVRHHHKLIWKPLEQQIHGSGLMKPALVATAWTQSSVRRPSIVPHHCIVHMGGAVMDMIGGCSLHHLKMNNGTVSST